MYKAIKNFTDKKQALRYFNTIQLGVKWRTGCGEIAKCATITVIDNTIEATSNYFTDWTLQKMLESKGKNY